MRSRPSSGRLGEAKLRLDGHLLPVKNGEKAKSFYSAAFDLLRLLPFAGTPISITSKPVLSAA